ncbi:hypothetical protein [Candidatus Sororendozoicomonas aggregata]|uniref:hypothetical protein n=1 Tax=Candidatus Sororendozoicomonas aggregata TaxID=3073239 RepID=UPI002ED615ED
MKKTMITLLLLLTVPLLYAQEVTLVNNIKTTQTQSGEKPPKPSSPSVIKRISVSVHDGKTKEYSLAYPNSPMETAKITLNKGARYQINVEGINNHWYHTNELTFQPGNTQGNTESITINGKGLPYTVERQGEIISSFYNEQNWLAYKVNCTHHSGDGLDGVQCLLNNPAEDSPIRISTLQAASQITPYQSDGVVFIDTKSAKQNISDKKYKVTLARLAPLYGHEQLEISDNQGHTVGWGVLLTSEKAPPSKISDLNKGRFIPAP